MPKTYIPVAIQRAVLELSKGYCEYCVIPSNFSTDYFHHEHIIPLTLDGKTELGNLARSCGICNNNKSDKIKHTDPLTKQIIRLYHPRQDIWTDHFQWRAILRGLFLFKKPLIPLPIKSAYGGCPS